MTRRLPRYCVGLVCLWACAHARAAERTGEQIYRQTCARCHGANGEGTKDYPHALAGDRSTAQLAKLIAKTMPDDAPGTCTGADAEKVAAYLFENYYSKIARERQQPPRVELTRLTVRQYRNAVADLMGSFRPTTPWGDVRGLQGEYFNARGFNRDKRIVDRIDPELRFDFGTEGPLPDRFDKMRFSIRWQGAVIAPESGEYEFIIRCNHAFKLFVNDVKVPVLDHWVRSDSETDFRTSLTLLAGRAYSLRVEFAKASQGVTEARFDKNFKGGNASIALEWQTPYGPVEVIPQRYLLPTRVAEAYVPTAAFPPDDRSRGWERGTAISKAWDQATTDGAIDAAGYVSAHLGEFASDRPQKGREFCQRFVERAFRRPLTEELKKLYIDRQFDNQPDVETAVKRVVLVALKSPRFLYREAAHETDGYAVAARLSFGLWDSLPDKVLLDAAAAGKLATRDQVVAHAERMLGDQRAKTKLTGFFHQWLKLDPAPDLTKAPGKFPGFDPAVAADLRTSLDLFIDDIAWGLTSDYRQLLLSESLFLNGRLAKYYGADLSADAPFQKVVLDPGRRAGLLTHPYLMATLAYSSTSSPIHRGLFLARGVLGQMLRPPPDAVAPLAPELHPNLTTRERIALQTNPQACQSCHAVINPLGFSLEHFDAVGRFRISEGDKLVDATGSYLTRSGDLVRFAGVRELADFLANSSETHDAFVEHLFHHVVQQPVRAYGPNCLAELRRAFDANGCSIRKLLVEIVATTALTSREGLKP